MKDKKVYFNVMRNYKTRSSNLIANIVAYDSWSDEFARKELNKLYELLINEFKDIDFTQFTPDELKTFDFRWRK